MTSSRRHRMPLCIPLKLTKKKIRLNPALKAVAGETGLPSLDTWISNAVIAMVAFAPGVTLDSSVALTMAGTSVLVAVCVIVGVKVKVGVRVMVGEGVFVGVFVAVGV